jgi:hypothetical protein
MESRKLPNGKKPRSPFNIIKFILILIGRINPLKNRRKKSTCRNKPSEKIISVFIDISKAYHDGYCSGAEWKKEEKELEITFPISDLPEQFKHYSNPNRLSKSLCNNRIYIPCGEKKSKTRRISYDSLSECGWFENFEKKKTCCDQGSGYCGFTSYSDLYIVRYIEFDGVRVYRPD